MSTPTFPTDEQVEAAAKENCRLFAEQTCQPFDHAWMLHGEECRNEARAMLTAALAPEFIAQIVAAHSSDGPHIPDPDYARIYTKARCIAWQYGFACVAHGSFTRDLDLLLVPWEANACWDKVEPIIKMLAGAADLRFRDGKDEPHLSTVDWTEKPHGRRSTTLHFTRFGDRRWVDISVMPCVAAHSEPKVPNEVAELEQEIRRIKAAFHVNMMRAYPQKTHDEIAAAIETAIAAERHHGITGEKQ